MSFGGTELYSNEIPPVLYKHSELWLVVILCVFDYSYTDLRVIIQTYIESRL